MMSGLKANRIVVPVDFSDLSFSAVDQACGIVEDAGTVEVIHVLSVLPASEIGGIYDSYTDEKRIEFANQQIQERLVKGKNKKVAVTVLVGDPGQEIAAFAALKEADMIVMPSHGYGFVKHLLLGSVAERVVRLAHCPVLVLRN
jgi:nucleotide-binding universal stress UspA family protein